MCVWSSLSADWNQAGMVANPARGTGKMEFSLSPFEPLNVWSCELGTGVPSRVSPLILRTKAKSGAHLRDSISPLPSFRYLFHRTVLRHRASPKFLRSRNLVNDGVHYRESAGTEPVVLRVAQHTEASLSGYRMEQLMRIPPKRACATG